MLLPVLLIAACLMMWGCSKGKINPMSSSEQEQLISALRDAYRAFNRGDLDAAVQLLSPDVEWSEPPEFPGGGSYHGRDRAKQYLTQSRAAWSEVESQPEDFVVVGNRIVVFVRARLKAKSTDAWREVKLADVYTFQNGQAVNMQAFADRKQALKWVGVEK